jgi:hypothetical protein
VLICWKRLSANQFEIQISKEVAMNPRRPLPLLLLSLLLAGAWSCDRTNSGPPVTREGGSSVESERTREMDDKAADLERQAESIKTMEGSDQDKIDAINKLEQDRQQLNETAEGSSEGGN